jgi:hypothetical protein
MLEKNYMPFTFLTYYYRRIFNIRKIHPPSQHKQYLSQPFNNTSLLHTLPQLLKLIQLLPSRSSTVPFSPETLSEFHRTSHPISDLAHFARLLLLLATLYLLLLIYHTAYALHCTPTASYFDILHPSIHSKLRAIM